MRDLNRNDPIALPEHIIAHEILGLGSGSPGTANIARRDVLANIGDPETYFNAGQPFFWEDRSGASKGDAFWIAVSRTGGWSWERLRFWDGVP